MPRETDGRGARFSALERDAWAGFLTTHARVTRKLDAELLASHRLPLTHFDVLMQLSIAGGRLRMAELAEAVLLSRSGLTRMIDALEADGLVIREPDPGDARGLYAVLTRRGRSRLRTVATAHVANVRRHFLDLLTGEQQQTLAGCWEAIGSSLETTGRAARRRASRATTPPRA